MDVIRMNPDCILNRRAALSVYLIIFCRGNVVRLVVILAWEKPTARGKDLIYGMIFEAKGSEIGERENTC